MKNTKLPDKIYADIVGLMPILCVDLIIRDHDNNILLIERNNEPLKGMYWLVGGRVYRNESMKQAMHRIAKEEVGLQVEENFLKGYYDEYFPECPYGDKGIHTISFVFEVRAKTFDVKLDEQSSNYKWSRNLPTYFLDNFGNK